MRATVASHLARRAVLARLHVGVVAQRQRGALAADAPVALQRRCPRRAAQQEGADECELHGDVVLLQRVLIGRVWPADVGNCIHTVSVNKQCDRCGVTCCAR